MAGQSNGSLEIVRDPEDHRKEWRFEHLGWILMALMVAAALLGLLGSGPLSKKTAGEPSSSLWIEYERFCRRQAPARLDIHLNTGDGRERAQLWVNRSFIDNVQTEHIDPEPEQVTSGPDRVVFTFMVSGSGQTPIRIYFKPHAIGRNPIRLGLVEGPQIEVFQFVYP